MGTTAELVRILTERHRLIVIGGLAVIGHGFNRPTMDADMWLDPLSSPGEWAAVVENACSKISGLTIHTLPGWRPITGDEIAVAADEVGMVRVNGLDCPLDLFRRPNEFEAGSFDEVYKRGTPNRDGTLLPDPLDLLVTKLNTGRTKDLHDMRHLESVVRERYKAMIPSAALEQIEEWFGRYLDWEVCGYALDHPDPAVRSHAIHCLRELATEGDPFSLALLEDRKIPYSPL
jgi:hypothetical protein